MDEFMQSPLPPSVALPAPPPVQGPGWLKLLPAIAQGLAGGIGGAIAGPGAPGVGLQAFAQAQRDQQILGERERMNQAVLQERDQEQKLARQREVNDFLIQAGQQLANVTNEQEYDQLLGMFKQRLQQLGESPSLVEQIPFPRTRVQALRVKTAKEVVDNIIDAHGDDGSGKKSIAAVFKNLGEFGLKSSWRDPVTGTDKTILEWVQEAGRVGEAMPSPVPPTEPKPVGEVERYLAMTPEEQAAYRQAKKDLGEAGRAPNVNVNVPPLMGGNDIETIADEIVNGNQPPDTKGLYRYGGALRAALGRRGYNLTRANLDWEATKRFYTSANSTQQIRMKQAADTAFHSLDVIEELADEWNGSGFPPLNRVKLAAAKNGMLGPQAASIATRLEAQISDLVSELGNVYMGGNSPTDHSLDLAKQNLSADWSEKVLRDAIELARTNLRIRINALKNVSAVTPSSVASPEPLVGGMTPAAPKRRAIKGGGVAEYRDGKWIRVQ